MRHRLLVIGIVAAVLCGSAGVAYALTSDGASGPPAHVAATDVALPTPTPSARPSALPAPSASPSPTPVAKQVPKPAPKPVPKAAPRPAPKPNPKPPSSGIDYNAAVNAVLAQLNAARAKHHAAPLTIEVHLIRTARAHNALMAGGCGMKHVCPGEPGLDRLWAAGVTDHALGENIGYGYGTATTSAVTAMAQRLTADMLAEVPPEDGHRKNILNAGFTHVGIAIVRDASGRVWMTQDFSGPSLPG